ncbi:unnamed protein product [Cunninghamella echinulata]
MTPSNKRRMGWLPSKVPTEHGCHCGADSITLNHYLSSCSLLINNLECMDYILHKYIPNYIPPTNTSNEIDFLLDCLLIYFDKMYNQCWHETGHFITNTFCVAKISMTFFLPLFP